MLDTRLSRLLDDLATARLANTVNRLMRRLAKVDLLILDDRVMTELTTPQRRDLMEIVDDRMTAAPSFSPPRCRSIAGMA